MIKVCDAQYRPVAVLVRIHLPSFAVMDGSAAGSLCTAEDGSTKHADDASDSYSHAAICTLAANPRYRSERGRGPEWLKGCALGVEPR